ncbi:MAG: hypothetical protein WD226_02110 [Planctomycetota bacterium]
MRQPSIHDLEPALARDARRIVETLEQAGHEAWLVGGAPRDLALERPVEDVDIATAATPDEIEALFPVVHAVGRAFGTLVVPGESGSIEVTTFRSEHGYSDGRRPDEVVFTRSLVDDAERRDFTANALYLQPVTGELADPTGGLADIAARRLRAVGDAGKRFAEDGLRILRLARFAAVLDFAMEPATAYAARRGLENLRGVSPERVTHEWEKAAKHGVVARFATNLDLLGALFVTHPALAAALEGAGVDDRPDRARWLANLDASADAAFALATLHLPAGAFDAQRAEVALRSLHVSRAARNRALALWENVVQAAAPPLEPRAREWRRLAKPTFREDLCIAELAGRVTPEDAARWRRWGAERSVETPEPLLEARDLLELGVAPGPEVGRLLRGLVDAQLEGRVQDVEEARAWVVGERA